MREPLTEEDLATFARLRGESHPSTDVVHDPGEDCAECDDGLPNAAPRPARGFQLRSPEEVLDIALRHSAEIKAAASAEEPPTRREPSSAPPEPDGDEESAYDAGAGR